MATLLDAHSQSHYNVNANLLAVHPSSSASASAYGQAFTVKTTGEKYKITHAIFFLKKIGSPTGHLKACLYSMTGTYGVDAKPTGSPLATSELVDAAPLGDLYPVSFSFVGDQQYEVLKDHKYCIVVQVNDGDNFNLSNYVRCSDSIGDNATHDGNHVHFLASQWSGHSSNDLIFYVYGEYVEPPPPETFTITVASGDYGHTVPTEGNYEKEEGEWVTVEAVADGGYTFHIWTRNGKTSSENPYGFGVVKDETVTAYFEEEWAPSGGKWTSPTGHIEGDWINETNIYDDDTSTHGDYYVPARNWSPFVELTLDNPIPCNRIRFFASFNPSYVNTIDVDVYADGEWIHVYEGEYPSKEWDEKGFDAKSITKARIKFYNNGASDMYVSFYEFDFLELPINAPLLAVRLGGNLAVMLTGSDKGKATILL